MGCYGRGKVGKLAEIVAGGGAGRRDQPGRGDLVARLGVEPREVWAESVTSGHRIGKGLVMPPRRSTFSAALASPQVDHAGA
jgi:hypothetical protein